MVDEIKDDEMAEFQECFELFDRDGDGALTAKEVEVAVRALGQNPNEFEMKEMLEGADPEETGRFEFMQFLEIVAQKLKDTDNEEELREAFRVFDQEGNGRLSAAELRHCLTTLGDKMTEAEADELIREADIDNDGEIVYEEFINILMHRAYLNEKKLT